VIEQVLKVLVDAGATPASAARAAVILDGGGSVREAGDVLEYTGEPAAAFDVELLLAQARRERIHVLAGGAS
jgi:hypothetical protein